MKLLPEESDPEPSDFNTIAANTCSSHCKKNKHLQEDERKVIVEMLLKEQRDGKLPQGALLKVANFFSMSRRSISRLWKEQSV